jgi:hypothetical protein
VVAGIALVAVLLQMLACSSPEPVDGFWGYRWGTSIDSVLADSADIRTRFGSNRYRFSRSGQRLVFDGVQYGLGYDRVSLDFSPTHGLWHGRVRVFTTAVDSVLEGLQDKYGRETSAHRIESPAGYITYWQTRDWLDRDFFAADRRPDWTAADVHSLEAFAGGCPVECPLYSVRLFKTGKAYLWSVRGLEPVGGFSGDFDPALFPPLATAATRPEFVALASDYTYRGTNQTTHGIRPDYGDRRTLVRSTERTGPPALEDLVTEIETIAASISWQQLVSWDTLRPGTEQHLHLDSLERLAEAHSD